MSLPRRKTVASRWRVAMRLARRQVARTRLASLLVATLVALPIGGMSGFAVWTASSTGTPEERAHIELGRMQAWVQPAGAAEAGFWQVPDSPDWTGYPLDASGAWTMPSEAPPEDPLAALPAGTEAVEVYENGQVRVDTANGSTAVTAWFGQTWHEGFAGRYDLVDGTRPTAPDEALVTPATMQRIGVDVGGTLTLTETGARYTVVGTADAAGVPDAEAGVFLPLDLTAVDASAPFASGNHRWYLPDLTLRWEDVRALNDDGVVALSRAVLLDPPTDLPEQIRRAQASQAAGFWSIVAVIAVGGAFAAYVVVMLAGAAFAVAARRQQRALAIAASVGATGPDLFRTIVLQGTALGAVGGVAGTVFGVGGAAAVLAATDDGSGTQPWGFHAPWWVLAGILVFAVVVGTLSALLPARSVARTDAISALRGARRPQRPTATRPVLGSVLLLAGIGVTIASGLTLAVVAGAAGLAPDSPLRWLPVWGIVAGPIIAQAGILLSGRWLLWTASRALTSVSTAARIASRDAAANASRTVPAFAAIGATVFLGIFVAAVVSMSTADSVRRWSPESPVGALAVFAEPAIQGEGSGSPLTPDETAEAMAAAREVALDLGASSVATVAHQTPWAWPDPAMAPDNAVQAMAVLPEKHLMDPRDGTPYFGVGDPQNNLAVIAPEELATAMDVELSPTELAAYRNGAAIVTDSRFAVDGEAEIAAWTLSSMRNGLMPNNVWAPLPDEREPIAPVWSTQVRAVVVDGPPSATPIALAPASAQELGLRTATDKTVATFDEPLSPQERDRVYSYAQAASTDDFTLNASVQSGPPSAASWLVPLLSVVAVLVVGASSVALGLARFERRPDDATLAAVGGTPLLRRHIGFWQGLIIAGFGTLGGALAGILPAVGLSLQSADTMRMSDVPWPLLGALAVLLPLAIAGANMLVPPRAPDLARRNVIA